MSHRGTDISPHSPHKHTGGWTGIQGQPRAMARVTQLVIEGGEKRRGINDGERREEVVIFRYRGYNVHFQRPGLRGIHPAEGETAGRQQRTGTKDHQGPGLALHWGQGGVVTPHSAWWNLGLLHADVTFTSCVTLARMP